MRIIAGELRGRKLLPPEGDTTRPITDRVKQSLFDILAPRLDDAIVLDLFAGTGSMGLECLSRGARHATFYETDRSALDRLRRNIEALGLVDRSKVAAGDLFRWFRDAASAPSPATRPSIAFLDPPYRFLRDRPDDLRKLSTDLVRLLEPEGLVIFRHDVADALALPELKCIDQRTYGGMALEFLQPSRPQMESEMESSI